MREAAGVLVGWLLLLSPLTAQQTDTSTAKGVLYGTVTDSEGNAAKGINLRANPLGVALAAVLPQTRTDQNGRYKFERIPWWGRYTIYAEDPEAGYSLFSTGIGSNQPEEVTISPEHPNAELNVRLPPKAGFLHIHLTNEVTGAVIPSLFIDVMRQETPSKLLFSTSCGSERPILIPPDKDLLLHVRSPGFSEWRESAGMGRFIRIGSGEHLQLDVPLMPSH